MGCHPELGLDIGAKVVKQKPEGQKKQQNRNAQRASDLGITYNKDKTVKVDKEK